MQKHPMYSVKEAAVALGCDERWVREQLNQGQLKGEKQSIGMKEKWFVYKGEIDRAIARKGAPNQVSQQQASQAFFGIEEDTAEPIDAEVQSSAPQIAASNSISELVKIIANQFAEKLDEQKSINYHLQRELEDKERQLKLLPDLEKRAEEAKLKQFELEALKKQLVEVQASREKAESEARKAHQVEESVLPELRKQIDAEREEKTRAIAELTKERDAAKELSEMIEKSSDEKAALQIDLEALKKELEQLKKPWWKKWFETPPAE